MKLGSIGYECEAQGQWSLADSPNTQRPALYSSIVGDTLRLTIQLGGAFSLKFLKHQWSGLVRLSSGASPLEVDLFSDADGGEILDIDFPDSYPREIEITVCAATNPRALASQVWFLGLVSGGRLRTIERGRALSPTVRVIAGDWGQFLTLRTDTGVAEALAKEGVWARHDIDLFKRHIASGDVVLDIGANFGHHTVVFSKLVGVEGLVAAFEPQSVMYQLLNANLVVNRIENAVALPYALGEREGTVEMFPISYDDFVNFGSLGINTSSPAEPTYGRGEQISVHRLDNVINRLIEKHCRVDFIKIDVQSFELFVIKGAYQVLSLHKPTLFLEVAPVWMRKAGYDYKEIYYWLHNIGYEIFHPTDQSIEKNGIKEWDGKSDLEWDILAVHPQRRVRN